MLDKNAVLQVSEKTLENWEVVSLVERNLVEEKGYELMLYPYFTKSLVEEVGLNNIQGVGLFKVTKRIVDALLHYVDGYKIGFEIKGITYDYPYLSKYFLKDIKKLKEFVYEGKINKGYAICYHTLRDGDSMFNDYDVKCRVDIYSGPVEVGIIVEEICK